MLSSLGFCCLYSHGCLYCHLVISSVSCPCCFWLQAIPPVILIVSELLKFRCLCDPMILGSCNPRHLKGPGSLRSAQGTGSDQNATCAAVWAGVPVSLDPWGPSCYWCWGSCCGLLTSDPGCVRAPGSGCGASAHGLLGALVQTRRARCLFLRTQGITLLKANCEQDFPKANIAMEH